MLHAVLRDSSPIGIVPCDVSMRFPLESVVTTDGKTDSNILQGRRVAKSPNIPNRGSRFVCACWHCRSLRAGLLLRAADASRFGRIGIRLAGLHWSVRCVPQNFSAFRRRLLPGIGRHYPRAPTIFSTSLWSRGCLRAVRNAGQHLHRSCNRHRVAVARLPVCLTALSSASRRSPVRIAIMK